MYFTVSRHWAFLFLGALLNNAAAGYFIVAAFYLVLVVVFYLLRKTLFFPFIRDIIVRRIYDKTDNQL